MSQKSSSNTWETSEASGLYFLTDYLRNTAEKHHYTQIRCSSWSPHFLFCLFFVFWFCFFFAFCFFRATCVAYGSSRLGVETEQQLPAYTIATATRDPSHICDLHHSSQQCWILNPLSEAKEGTWILMVPSWVRYHWATTGTPLIPILDP